MTMTAQCEASDLYRQNSMDVSYVLAPITTITSNSTTTSTTTTSSSVDESASISPTDSANTSNVNIAQAASKPKLGTYLIDRTIGKGIFSVVKLATHTITGIDLAIKIIDKTRLDAENLVKIYRESEILKKLHHPNIVKLFQVMETPRLLYIAMEFLPNGEVFDYIANHGRFPEPEARVKFMDVLLAVDHIHSMGIVHRDIKAENLLFDAQMNIKLTDFSFGTHFSSSSSSQPLLTTWCGSPPYAAPEIFKGEPYVGTKADIWSLGVVLYVMVCGTLPFDAQPLPHLKNQVLSASFRVPYWLSLTCERLIRSMLSKSPAKRPSTQEIMQHPWLTNTPIPNSKSTQLPLHQASTGALVTETHIPIGHRILERPFTSIDMTYSSLTAGMSHPDRRCPSLIEHPVTSELTMSNSAPDGEVSNLNELVLLIMESLGMKRSQILESLERRAYDHLMATYLLLGEKLRRHCHNLSFASLTKSLGGTRTVNGLNTTPSVTKPDLGVGIVHTKHSCVDSAVDVKSSSSETEFNGSSILSMSVPDKEVHRDSYGTTRWHGSDHSQLTTRPHFTTAWTPNPDSTLPTPTLPTTDTTFRLSSYSHNRTMIHACPQSNIVNEDIAIDDDETPLFHMQQSTLSHDPPMDLSTSSALSATTTRGTLSVGCASGSFHVPEQPPVVCGCNPIVSSYDPSNKFTPVTGPNAVQTTQNNLPWVIHVEHDEKPAASPARRRTLVRRKYGVFTPPDNLSQLAQVALAQNSTNPVRHTTDLIDEDLG